MKRLTGMICALFPALILSASVSASYLDEYTEPARFSISMEDSAGEGKKQPGNPYAAYLDIVERCIEQYGDTGTLEGPCSDMHHYTGLSFVKLVDFNEDGNEELFLAFYVRTNDESDGFEESVYIYNIWGYDGTKAVLLQDGNYLFGTNGGMQTVLFVKNPNGIFYHHGAADSFRYDYYYGYTGKDFGLAKKLLCEHGAESTYSIDDREVSESEWRQEYEFWQGNPEDGEYYLLTYTSPEEDSRTRTVTSDTIEFLRQHAQDAEEPEEPEEEPAEPEEEPAEEEEPEKEEEPAREKPAPEEDPVPEKKELPGGFKWPWER